MLQIWQFTGTANRTFLIHFMIIVLLSLLPSRSTHKKQPSSLCYHLNLCVYTFGAARSPHSSHNQAQTPDNHITYWMEHHDAMSKMPFFIVLLRCRLWLFISVRSTLRKRSAERSGKESPAWFTWRLAFNWVSNLCAPLRLFVFWDLQKLLRNFESFWCLLIVSKHFPQFQSMSTKHSFELSTPTKDSGARK